VPAVLDDFLNYAKVRHLDLQPTDLNAEIAETLDFFEPEAHEGAIELIRYLDPDLPRVMLDREAFRGALLNLILNAKQAMPGGGQLIDTGCGMNESTASQMFDAFFSTKPGGSGLGLPTTAKIIEAHGGRIRVESEVGRGTHCRCRRGWKDNDECMCLFWRAGGTDSRSEWGLLRSEIFSNDCRCAKAQEVLYVVADHLLCCAHLPIGPYFPCGTLQVGFVVKFPECQHRRPPPAPARPFGR